MSQIAFQIRGTTDKPEVRGSVQAEKLNFNKYSVDEFRVFVFDIKDNFLSIDPGKMRIRKGEFTAGSVGGRVAWSWALPGPVMDGPLHLHMEVQDASKKKNDFQAITQVLMPAIQAPYAEVFTGSVDVTGTLNNPQISGMVKIGGGRFRFDPAQNALEAGVTDISGTVRFLDGNRLEIDEADPLKARFVRASDIQSTELAASSKKPAANNSKVVEGPSLSGQLTVRGSVDLQLQLKQAFAAAPTPDDPGENGPNRPAPLNLDPNSALARNRYNLQMTLDGGSYNSPALSGVKNLAIGAIWRTGAGRPETNQIVRWMLAAEGPADKKGKTQGKITSIGSIRLEKDFGSGINSALYSTAEDFAGSEDFSGMLVSQRVHADTLPDKRPQMLVEAFPVSVKDLGHGQLDGRLVLDNQPTSQSAPAEAVGLQQATLRTRLRGQVRRTSLLGSAMPLRHDYLAGGIADFPKSDIALESPPPQSRSLRLGGTLTLSNAECFGAPAGGGVPMKLSVLPVAPRLDLKLVLGKSVQVVTAALRSGLVGEVTVGGTPREPQVYGTVATRDGQVRFPNARARIESGQVTLAASRDPETDFLRTRIEVDVTAKGTSGRYDITLHLRGPLDMSDPTAQNMQVDVTSNPPLSQTDAFQQLLGTSVHTDSGEVTNAYSKAVVGVVTAPLFSGVENSLAKTFGLSSVTLEYRFNEPLFVQLAKDIGDRVIISYRRNIGQVKAGEKTAFQLRVDYKIKGDLSLGVQYDERQVPSVTLQKSWKFW